MKNPHQNNTAGESAKDLSVFENAGDTLKTANAQSIIIKPVSKTAYAK